MATGVSMHLLAPFCPPERHLHGILEIRVVIRQRGAFVKRHDNIRAERALDFNGTFRANKMFHTIDWGTKRNAFLSYRAEGAEAKHLKPTAIRQNRVLPAHKSVQTAGISDNLVPGTEIEVVGIR